MRGSDRLFALPTPAQKLPAIESRFGYRASNVNNVLERVRLDHGLA
jgi:hypothetical protein